MTTDATLNGVALSSAVPDAIVLRPARHLVGPRRHQALDVPGRAGPWIFGEQPGAGTVELAVSIQSASLAARRAAVSALADWVDLDATARLIVDDLADRYYDAILITDPDVEEWLNSADITLAFLTGPYSLAVSTSSQAVTASSSPSSSSFSIPDEIGPEAVFELTPAGGTLDSFTLTVNGETLNYGGPSVTAGNTVTVSGISDTVTLGLNADTDLTGAYAGTEVLGDVTGTFPDLVAGSNDWSLSWEGAATSVVIDITWRRRYR